ncbi:hypothetical protein Cni_G27916 [Canna indica]|uniref:Uncharacterized protein n=1 Tax=Canna indica TaxID=4628 RepID=A0AAQ3L2K2_9LILI|nr:hypothetical protein Cni_G27916 [Canna indica]
MSRDIRTPYQIRNSIFRWISQPLTPPAENGRTGAMGAEIYNGRTRCPSSGALRISFSAGYQLHKGSEAFRGSSFTWPAVGLAIAIAVLIVEAREVRVISA